MIRYRRPKQDDTVILDLIEKQLVPLSHLPQTVINQVRKDLPRRLGQGVTLVACPDYESDPLGFVHFMLHGDLLYIDMLAVAPAARRKHWGICSWTAQSDLHYLAVVSGPRLLLILEILPVFPFIKKWATE